MIVGTEVNVVIHARRCSWLRSWIASACLILFVAVGIAEATHLHSGSGKGTDEQHCSLCITAHSVARPAQITTVLAAPTQCLGFLVVAGSVLLDSQSVLSFHIRPPPAA